MYISYKEQRKTKERRVLYLAEKKHKGSTQDYTVSLKRGKKKRLDSTVEDFVIPLRYGLSQAWEEYEEAWLDSWGRWAYHLIPQ